MPVSDRTERPTLATRLNRTLAQMVISDAHGATTRYGRDARAHRQRGASAPPPAVSSIALEWAEFVRRLVDMAEYDLAVLRGQAPRPHVGERRVGSAGRIGSKLADERRRRIATAELYRGRPPEFVAYVEACSTEHVRRVRGERGLDPATGHLRRDSPLTSRVAAAEPRAAT